MHKRVPRHLICLVFKLPSPSSFPGAGSTPQPDLILWVGERGRQVRGALSGGSWFLRQANYGLPN